MTDDKLGEELDSIDNVKLDEVVKSLLDLSDECILGTINECFGKDYKVGKAKIKHIKSKFARPEFNFDEIEGDLLIEIDGIHYHIEIQTLNDSEMQVRLVEYAVSMSKSVAKLDEDGVMVMRMPRQAVIFIEQNRGIKDQKIKLIAPDDQSITYSIPTIRLWEYDIEELVTKKMYCLLPLVVFRYRKSLQSIVNSKSKTKNKPLEIQKEREQLIDTIKQLNLEVKKLIDGKLIKLSDMHTMLLAMTNLTHYLNHKFISDSNLTGEVIKMTKTLYDPEVEKRGEQRGIEKGRIDVAKNALLAGIEPSVVSTISGLTLEAIEKLQEDL